MNKRLLVALALGMTAFVAPPQVGHVRADNLGGLFEECAELVEFVAPASSNDGHLTLVGIGPGLYNAIGDETHHRFPFGPDISINSTIASRLMALASDDSFTCLRMTGDGMGLVTAVTLDPQVQVCGTIARDTSGIFSINRPADAVHMELIAEAETIVEEGAINRTLIELANSEYTICLKFQLDGVGLIDSITVDATFSACGRIENRVNLVVGSFIVANVGSTSEALIPEPAVTAARLVMPPLGTEGCVHVEVRASRIVEALLTAEDTVCGVVVFPDIGDVTINEVSIRRTLFTSAQLGDLKLAAGGTACFTVTISANRYGSSLSTFPPTPSPTPSASPSATPSASPSATPSATVDEVVSPPGENDGAPTGLLLGLMGVSLAGIGGIGYLIWRRMQGSGPGPIDGGLGDQPVAPGIGAAGLALGRASVAPGPDPSEIARFTPREQEVLAMLYEGMSNKEIGSRLFITESTAGVHVSNIMMKLGAKSRAEAAALAHRMGLTSYEGPQH